MSALTFIAYILVTIIIGGISVFCIIITIIDKDFMFKIMFSLLGALSGYLCYSFIVAI